MASGLRPRYTWGMDKKIPPLLKDFINKVTPSPFMTPVSELQERYIEKREEERRRAAVLPAPNLHGFDFVVEMRIREWMQRMQREAEEAKRLQAFVDKHKSKNITPPKPPSPK